jgi:hypothetical protein
VSIYRSIATNIALRIGILPIEVNSLQKEKLIPKRSKVNKKYISRYIPAVPSSIKSISQIELGIIFFCDFI